MGIFFDLILVYLFGRFEDNEIASLNHLTLNIKSEKPWRKQNIFKFRNLELHFVI